MFSWPIAIIIKFSNKEQDVVLTRASSSWNCSITQNFQVSHAAQTVNKLAAPMLLSATTVTNVSGVSATILCLCVCVHVHAHIYAGF